MGHPLHNSPQPAMAGTTLTTWCSFINVALEIAACFEPIQVRGQEFSDKGYSFPMRRMNTVSRVL